MNKDYQREEYKIEGARPDLLNMSVGTLQVIQVLDSAGKETRISFRVTRNVRLGSSQHWVYGQVLEPAGDFYRQVEIKIHMNHPEYDTVEIYPQAPPV